MAPHSDVRHPVRRIFMHAAYILWVGFGPSGVLKPRFSPIETGLCRISHQDFADITFHELIR